MLAISNIALPAYEHQDELMALKALGLHGIEVAPSRVWRDTWHGLTSGDVTAYRKQIEAAGLSVVGLHSLFFDQPKLGLCKGDVGLAKTVSFLAHLSGVCRDLGGRTLIWGGGRRRGAVSLEKAKAEATRMLEQLLPTFELHGTCFCFEPLGPADTDFLNSAHDIKAFIADFNSPALKIQLDAKALVENDEATLKTFHAVADDLVHFHANEPGLDVIGRSGKIPHQMLASFLDQIGYDGFVSIEQRMFEPAAAFTDVQESVRHMKQFYKGDAM